ncbi:caspase family protein [Dongia sp.]|jgi:hypothetical protein|uniref:caspase family protein n=1 Tax=Dongia sp. TaxID=1977262 RepID=UPI0035AD8757
MASGYALCLGLNSVDPHHYQGWSGELRACEADARDMATIAQANGFQAKLLLTSSATRSNFIAAIRSLAGTAGAGDLVMISYSGHGGQLGDLNGDEQDDHKDETWCLYDGQFVDDETYLLLSAFKPGVRVLVFADSCHSGTSTKEMLLADNMSSVRVAGGSLPVPTLGSVRYKAMPAAVQQRVYQANKSMYDIILRDAAVLRAQNQIAASCLLFSGCQDNQLSADGSENGRFTGQLKVVWSNGRFKGSYADFYNMILKGMPPDQTPNLFPLGRDIETFKAQAPFAIYPRGGGRIMSNKIVSGDQWYDLDGRQIVIRFNGIQIKQAADLDNMVGCITPMIAKALSESINNNREWSVSGTVTTTSGGTTGTVSGTYTSRDWGASVTASGPIGGGVSGSVTISTGSSGNSGSIGLSGSF